MLISQTLNLFSFRFLITTNKKFHFCVACKSFWNAQSISIKPLCWKEAVAEAEKIVGYSTSFLSLRYLLSDELSNVAKHLKKLAGTKHPILKTARELFYNNNESMQTRGFLILLTSKCAGPTKSMDEREVMISGIYHSQRLLAEAAEMISMANLIHKSIINLADVDPEVHGSLDDMNLGNKMAVLSGDFLLAKSSMTLAKLGNTKVVELMASTIRDLMSAEFTRIKEISNPSLSNSANSNDHFRLKPITHDFTMSEWEEQIFLSSGTLLAKSCKAGLMLVDHTAECQEAMFQFSRNMALAYQLNEDISNYRLLANGGQSENFNPSTCGPVILSNVQDKTLLDTFKDADRLISLAVQKRTEYSNIATDSLKIFPPSDAKYALINIVRAIT